MSDCVTNSLRRYVEDLNGETPSELYEMVMNEVEKPLLQFIMERTDCNQTRAARILGINRNTLRKKLNEHGIA